MCLPAAEPARSDADYILGPDDAISLMVRDADEFAGTTFRLDANGEVTLPFIGRRRLGGLPVQTAESTLTAALSKYIQQPEVILFIQEYRSQRVSVVGSVNSPGVHALQGAKTLIETLALAGGLRTDAGFKVKITRRIENGVLPLPGAVVDPTRLYSVGEVGLNGMMEAQNPSENILMAAGDVISVPRAEMVYVFGEVQRSGAYVLNDRGTMSALQALSLAGGVARTAAIHQVKVLRPQPGSPERKELTVNVKNILAGKSPDVMLRPEDILIVPGSTKKKIVYRAIETAVQTASGIAIWRTANN